MTMGELQCRWWVFGHVFNAFRKCYRRENVRVISDGCSASAVFRFQAHADSLLQAPALLVCFLLTATENRRIAFETTSLTVLTTSTCNMYTLSEEGRTGRSDSWWTCQTVECLGRLGDILKLHSSGRFRNLYTAFPRRQVHRFQTSENSIDRIFFPWMIPTEVLWGFLPRLCQTMSPRNRADDGSFLSASPRWCSADLRSRNPQMTYTLCRVMTRIGRCQRPALTGRLRYMQASNRYTLTWTWLWCP